MVDYGYRSWIYYYQNFNSQYVSIARQHEQMDTRKNDHVYSLAALPSGGEGQSLPLNLDEGCDGFNHRARWGPGLKKSKIFYMVFAFN